MRRRLNLYGMAAMTCMCLSMCIWTLSIGFEPLVATSIYEGFSADGYKVTYVDLPDGERAMLRGWHGSGARITITTTDGRRLLLKGRKCRGERIMVVKQSDVYVVAVHDINIYSDHKE